MGDCIQRARRGANPIGKLQRYATDLAYREGWGFFTAGAPTGKSVGLVGGGPASLACAHELRRLGHACTIYDKRSILGGLNTTGVAPYKMRAEASVDEVASGCMQIGGIEVKTGVAVGSELPWTTLEQRHDAIFVGLGLGEDSRLGVPGESRRRLRRGRLHRAHEARQARPFARRARRGRGRR